MTAPWAIFAFGVMGLIVGGGIEVITAPTTWIVGAFDAPTIMNAQVCAIADLHERTPS